MYSRIVYVFEQINEHWSLEKNHNTTKNSKRDTAHQPIRIQVMHNNSRTDRLQTSGCNCWNNQRSSTHSRRFGACRKHLRLARRSARVYRLPRLEWTQYLLSVALTSPIMAALLRSHTQLLGYGIRIG